MGMAKRITNIIRGSKRRSWTGFPFELLATIAIDLSTPTSSSYQPLANTHLVIAGFGPLFNGGRNLKVSVKLLSLPLIFQHNLLPTVFAVSP